MAKLDDIETQIDINIISPHLNKSLRGVSLLPKTRQVNSSISINEDFVDIYLSAHTFDDSIRNDRKTIDLGSTKLSSEQIGRIHGMSCIFEQIYAPHDKYIDEIIEEERKLGIFSDLKDMEKSRTKFCRASNNFNELLSHILVKNVLSSRKVHSKKLGRFSKHEDKKSNRKASVPTTISSEVSKTKKSTSATEVVVTITEPCKNFKFADRSTKARSSPLPASLNDKSDIKSTKGSTSVRSSRKKNVDNGPPPRPSGMESARASLKGKKCRVDILFN